MKGHIAGAILLMLVVSGCCKSSKISEQFTTVTIDYRLYSEEPMTKSVYTNPVLSYIDGVLPSSLTFSLIDEEGNRTSVVSGQSVTLKLGTYTVKANYTPSIVAQIVGATVFASNQPSISVNTTLTVTASQTAYIVQAHYSCFAIVVDNEEVKRVAYSSSHGETGTFEMNPVSANAYGIIFIIGPLNNQTMDVVLTANDITLEDTSYTFYEKGSAGNVFVQYGKYYILHPKAKTSVDEGYLSYFLDDWTEEEVY